MNDELKDQIDDMFKDDMDKHNTDDPELYFQEKSTLNSKIIFEFEMTDDDRVVDVQIFSTRYNDEGVREKFGEPLALSRYDLEKDDYGMMLLESAEEGTSYRRLPA